MDPTRFDAMARQWGHARARRTVLKTLGAAALGALGLAGPARPAVAQTCTDDGCDDENACTEDRCDPEGGCVYTKINCDDHDLCTDDSCDPERGCVFTSITCDDDNPCTDDRCDSSVGCVFTPVADDTPCPLSGGGSGTCQGGNCVATCPSGEARCGGTCVSLTKDKNNCGGCGIRCGAKGSCGNGVCVPK
jgi:Dictyostelium (slime mold) repeat